MKQRRYLDALNRCRRRLLIIALRKHHGRVAYAADYLGIDRAGMYTMLKEHGLEPWRFRPRRIPAGSPPAGVSAPQRTMGTGRSGGLTVT